MIEEVKKIKLEELNKKKAEYDEKEFSIIKKLGDLRTKLWSLQWEQSNGLTVKCDFSFFEKWITKRNEYKIFKTQSKRFSELPKLISEISIELAEEELRVKEALEKSGITTTLQEIKQKIDFIESAKTLFEMGITPIDAIEVLESNGIQPVLSEADKYIFFHPRDYSSKSALIGVHKTDYAPTANIIKSAKDSNVEFKENITINGVDYKYYYKEARDTVHMAMNDEVSSHVYGSWDACKYAILIPFEDIPNEKIGRAAPMDTFTRGSLEMSENTWILCPKDEADKLKAFNPKVHVLGYEGENVLGFPQPFLTQLGYCAEDVDTWNWRDKESSHQFYKLMEKEGIKTGAHTNTYFHTEERMLRNINKAVSLSKLLRDNHLITNPEDIDNIMKQLKDNHKDFGSLLSSLVETSQLGSDFDSQSIMWNHKQVDIFLEEMKKNGFSISSVYQGIMKKLCEISIYNCNENNRDIIFNLPEEVSDEERNTIEELQAVLVPDSLIDHDEKKAAFGKFISNVIGNSILHSKEQELSKSELQEEPSI